MATNTAQVMSKFPTNKYLSSPKSCCYCQKIGFSEKAQNTFIFLETKLNVISITR